MATKNKPDTLCKSESVKKDENFDVSRLQNEVLSTAAPSPIMNSYLKAHIYLELEKLKIELQEINAKLRIKNDLLTVKKIKNERMKQIIESAKLLESEKSVEVANCFNSIKCLIV